MILENNNLDAYFSTGVEKKNDDLQRYFHRKINRWDAPTNLLLVEKRQEVPRDCYREKHSYVRESPYFGVEVKSKRPQGRLCEYQQLLPWNRMPPHLKEMCLATIDLKK